MSTESSVLTDQTSKTQLCKPCVNLDVDNLLRAPKYGSPSSVGIRRFPPDVAEIGCKLCRVFYNIRSLDKTGTRNFTYNIICASVSGIKFEYLYESSPLVPNDACLVVIPVSASLSAASSESLNWIGRWTLSFLRRRQPSLLVALGPPDYMPSETSCIDWELILCWIQQCQTCTQSPVDSWTTKVLAPSRYKIRTILMQHCLLIDCQKKILVPWTRGCRYLALSYVWGHTTEEQYQMATDATTWRPSSGQKLSESLPQTIIDAMEATLRLKYQYLWIDQFCIDQHSHAHKMSQIGMMDLIYSGSELTLVAAAGQSDRHGLPGVSGPRARIPRTLRIKYAETDATLTTELPHPAGTISVSYWASRGWTYQEAILSRRVLVFTEEQVYFECQPCATSYWEFAKGTAGTSGYFRKGCPPNPSWRDNTGAGDVWNRINSYNARQLSFESDRCNAVQGILSSYGPNLYGLPVKSQACFRDGGDWLSLDWCKANSPHAKFDRRRRRRRGAGMPSFSWVGWEMEVVPAPPSTMRLYDVQNLTETSDRDTSFALATEPAYTLRLRALIERYPNGHRQLSRDKAPTVAQANRDLVDEFAQFAAKFACSKILDFSRDRHFELGRDYEGDFAHLPGSPGSELNSADLGCAWIVFGSGFDSSQVETFRLSGLLIYKVGEVWERIGRLSVRLSGREMSEIVKSRFESLEENRVEFLLG